MPITEYDFVRHSIRLQTAPDKLFTPNKTTKLFTKAVKINPGDVVFDIGSGLGPLAIWAALEPSSHVYSVEIVKEQYELAKQNVKNNGLESKITLYNGKLFEPIPEGIKADVIIADVSGISERIARKMTTNGVHWYPLCIPTGGEDGTDIIRTVLEQAGNYLTPNGRLYYPVASLSNHQRIEDLAEKIYKTRNMIIEVDFPLEEGQKEMIERIGEQMMKETGGKAYTLGKKGSRYTWKGWIYEASNPS